MFSIGPNGGQVVRVRIRYYSLIPRIQDLNKLTQKENKGIIYLIFAYLMKSLLYINEYDSNREVLKP